MYKRYRGKRIRKDNFAAYMMAAYGMALALMIVLMAINASMHNNSVKQTEETPGPAQVDLQANTEATATHKEVEQASITEFEQVGEIEYVMYYTEEDIITMAKVMYKECRGVPSDTRVASVGWVACNRVDAGYGGTISEVLKKPGQFAWNSGSPVWDRLYEISADVLQRWNDEKNGMTDVGRVLPSEYLFFHGDGTNNHFRIKFKSDGKYWDYSLPSPYDS